MDADPFGPLGMIRSPSQGRPALLKVGGELAVSLQLPADFAGHVEMQLFPSHRPADADSIVPLSAVRELAAVRGPATGDKADPAPMSAFGTVKTPDYAAPGLYDLLVACYAPNQAQPTAVKVAPRAVALYDGWPTRFRFVQLSNMNVGDDTAADFSDELVTDVNRVAPAFIVTTGDYTEWAAGRDDAASWRRVKQYFARFEAPVFLVCGDHDHQPSFADWVAPSRCGQFFFGPYQAVLLHDNYAHPLDRDSGQVVWLDEVLASAEDVRFRFLVSANDSPRVLGAARKLGYAPADYFRRHRIGMLFAASHADWDYVEQSAALAGAPIHYVRTHESSTSLRGKSTGAPHYRIVQVDDRERDRAPATPPRVSFVVPENGPVQRAQHSAAVGQIKVAFEPAGDGSADQVTVRVLNRLTVPLPALRVKVRLKRPGAGAVSAVGGTIERVVNRGKVCEAWLRIDCPDRGVATAVVGPAHRLPTRDGQLEFNFLGDPAAAYTAARSPDGFGLFTTEAQGQLEMVNHAAEPRRFYPIVRLGGNVLGLEGVRPGEPIVLAGGERRTLPLRMALSAAAPGEHWLTLHLAGEPAGPRLARPIELIVSPAAGGTP